MKNKLNLKFAIKNPHTITYTYLKCPKNLQDRSRKKYNQQQKLIQYNHTNKNT